MQWQHVCWKKRTKHLYRSWQKKTKQKSYDGSPGKTWTLLLSRSASSLLAARHNSRRCFLSFSSACGRVKCQSSLSAREKRATKVFIRRVFAIFATNASFLLIIANFLIKFGIICNIYHVKVHSLLKKHCLWPIRALLLPKVFQKGRRSRQILISRQNTVC